jgi:hypothetical protein
VRRGSKIIVQRTQGQSTFIDEAVFNGTSTDSKGNVRMSYSISFRGRSRPKEVNLTKYSGEFAVYEVAEQMRAL